MVETKIAVQLRNRLIFRECISQIPFPHSLVSLSSSSTSFEFSFLRYSTGVFNEGTG